MSDDGLASAPTRRPTESPKANSRLTDAQVWDESARPLGPPPPAGHEYSQHGIAVGSHLIDVHDHLRLELSHLLEVIRRVQQGQASAGDARGALSDMTMRQHDWRIGAYCASYCRVVTTHHGIEDAAIFPHLRNSDRELAPVVERLQGEHEVIHGLLENVDSALVAYTNNDDDISELSLAVSLLSDALLSHLAYEEQQLVEPLARFGFYPGQV